MSEFLAKLFLFFLLIALAAFPSVAQNVSDDSQTSRRASFLPPDSSVTQTTVPSFSGLATRVPSSSLPVFAPPSPSPAASIVSTIPVEVPAVLPVQAQTPPVSMAPPVITPPVTTPPVVTATPSIPPPPTPAQVSAAVMAQTSPLTLPAPVVAAPATTQAVPPAAPLAAMIVAAPVTVTTIANISPESIGTQSTNGLGADMWKGTPRFMAEQLLSTAVPTSSPALNMLMKRLLTTAAVPPEGVTETAQQLTPIRVDQLLAFGDVADAWALVQKADPKLISDPTFHSASEAALMLSSDTLCNQVSELAKSRSEADWQKLVVVCQLRAKDTKAAQVALDVYHTQGNRDNVFFDIAQKNILNGNKTLPFQLTPLTAPTVALLQMTGLPLPNELFAHPNFSLAPALLHLPAQQDVAQLALAERLVARGIVDDTELASVYRAVNFTPDQLAAPLNASETGLRLRALLFRAAEGEKDPAKRILYTTKFVQTAPAALLNNAGPLCVTMLGTLKPDAPLAANALMIAYVEMVAGHGDVALEWLKLAQGASSFVEDEQDIWPQLALGGLESEATYEADLDKWLSLTVRASDQQNMHDNVAATLLLFDAAGLRVPDTAWAKIIANAHNDKHITFSPILLGRIEAVSNRRAETVLLALNLAGESDIPLPVAIGITRALRLAGFKSEAAIFARQTIALLAKAN